MQLTEAPEFKAKLIQQIAQREFKERTGTHCSDLIYCINKQALRRRLGETNTDKEVLLFSIGWSTQRWLTGKSEDEDSIECDGIIVTCDANALDILEPKAITRYLIPFELKATYQSSKKPVDENQHWIRQIMAQCYVTGNQVAYLSRFELMGDWNIKSGERPTLSAWRLEFTQEELNRNWLWLKARKERFEDIVATGQLVPKVVAIPSGQSYECDYCHFKDKECQVA